MDALRKQLDVLMGVNRNGDVEEVNRNYYDPDVCRLFLSGLCPHLLFHLTRMDRGPCPKVHSMQLRKEYEEAKAKGVDNYDRDLEDVIYKLIVECDKRINGAPKRFRDDDAKAAIAISVSEVTQNEEVMELSKQIKEKLKEVDQYDLEEKSDLKIRTMEEVEEMTRKRADKQAFNKDKDSLPQPLPNPPPLADPKPVLPLDAHTQQLINEKLQKAEDLGEQGMVDEAQKALEEAEALNRLAPRQEPAVGDSGKYTSTNVRITNQRLHVCDICGSFLNVYDRNSRLAEHFRGKLHLGYMRIREKLADLQEERNKRRVHEDDRTSRERSRDNDHERRDYDRRSRDCDRNDREHDRERDRERSLSHESRSRYRSRSRSRESSRDYGCDYDPDRCYSRDQY